MILKKPLLVLFVLVVSLLCYAGVLEKHDAPSSSATFSRQEFVPTVHRSWKFKDASSPSAKELEELLQSHLDQGIRNAPLLSLVLLRVAEQAVLRGDWTRAGDTADYAVRFSPEVPGPYFGRARISLRQHPFQLQRSMPDLVKGIRASVVSFPTCVRVSYNFLYIVSHALLMTFVVFGVMLLLKYIPLYFQEIRRNWAPGLSKALGAALKVVLLLVPFFFRLNMLWAILFWSVLVWGYVTRGERRWLIFFLLVLAYVPFFVRSWSSFLEGPGAGVLLEMTRANYEESDSATEENLRTWMQAHPDDAQVLFTVALLEKRRGRYARAEELYRKAAEKAPQWGSAFSNLGNVYLAESRTDPAITSYERALQLEGGNGVHYFNLSRAFSQEKLLSGKADEAFQRARQLTPELVDRYSRLDQPNLPANFNRLVIDEVLKPLSLWRRAMKASFGGEGWLRPLFQPWFERKGSGTPFLWPAFFLLFLIGMSRFGKGKRFLTRCSLCGAPTYRLYRGAPGQELVCANCSRVLVQKEKLHSRLELKKSFQMERFEKQNRIVARAVSFVLVGAGDLWRGDFFRGNVFLFFFFIFLVRFVFWNGVLAASTPEVFLSPWKAISWGVLFLAFYGYSVRRMFREKARPGIQSARKG
jgi:tetratricopeptide (TPR) repeat protein